MNSTVRGLTVFLLSVIVSLLPQGILLAIGTVITARLGFMETFGQGEYLLAITALNATVLLERFFTDSRSSLIGGLLKATELLMVIISAGLYAGIQTGLLIGSAPEVFLREKIIIWTFCLLALTVVICCIDVASIFLDEEKA